MGQAIRGALISFTIVVATVGLARAEGRETLGVANVFTNDRIGDGRDRWRTGGYSVSVIRGPAWEGELPSQFGQVLEYRFRGEIVAPDNLTNPNPNDRLYGGILSVGAHSHFDWQGFDVSAGADLVVVGEQTGLRSFQNSVHDLFSIPQSNVENYQIEDGVYLHGTVELAREYRFAQGVVRPFLEVQAGYETLARAGVDLTFGGFGDGGLLVRDVISGQRVTAINSEEDLGLSLMLGGDIAYVDSSELFTDTRGPEMENERYRLRAGFNYGIGGYNIFYGLTYMSEEFVGQSEGQLLGSVTFGFVF